MFRLEIATDSAELTEAPEYGIAAILRGLAARLEREAPIRDQNATLIRDINGARVGSWAFIREDD